MNPKPLPVPAEYPAPLDLGRAETEAPQRPSRLYRAGPWRMAQAAARTLPRGLALAMSQSAALAYAACNPGRRAVVAANLAPAIESSSPERAAWKLFAEFGIKLTDLWRYEAGLPVTQLFHEFTGWDHFQNAHQRGRGVLLLTIHLGNWEFGAPLLTARGLRLQVITQAEPHAPLTGVRQQARQRWDVDTLALGNDPFASVEIVRRLDQNHVIALLMDRPAGPSAVEVNLFHRSFRASIAAAELARASGCALLPVILPRSGRGYAAHILPEVTYDRRQLGSRGTRQQLTQTIIDSFAPSIRRYLTQWFHFVSVWPAPAR